MSKLSELARLEAAFGESGGRGVELAEKIDALRAEIAEDDRRRDALLGREWTAEAWESLSDAPPIVPARPRRLDDALACMSVEPGPLAGGVYRPDPALPNAYIFDLDGTLAVKTGDRKFFDWGRVGEDDVVEAVATVARSLHRQHHVVVLSGRDAICEPESIRWLRANAIPYDALLMRMANDNRPDEVVKLELFAHGVAPFYRVLAVFDDRDKVVAMWRRVGVPCFQVAPGDF